MSWLSEEEQTMGYARSISRYIIIYCMNAFSNIVGDDPIGRRLRCFGFRMAGVKIGPGTAIDGGTRISGFGLSIGEMSYVNRGCYFDLSGRVTIGDRVFIGPGVTFLTSDHEIGQHRQRAGNIRSGSIEIGDGVWVGANAVLFPNVRIGSGAIVAAGAIVRGNVGADSLVAGVPARVIRQLIE
jgi:maltose O-acetyltransferase